MSITNEREFVTRLREDKMMQNLAVILCLPDVKRLMVKMIITEINNVIDIARYQLYEEEAYTIKETKFSLFDWPLEKYTERVLTNEHYIDIYKFEDLAAMNILKFLKDMTNLQHLLGEILKSDNRGLDVLNDCMSYLTVVEDLQKELKKNKKILAKERKEFEKFLQYDMEKRQLKDDSLNEVIDNSMDEVLIIDPTIVRYHITSIKTHHEDFAMKWKLTLDELEKAVADYLNRIPTCASIHERQIAFSYMEIDELKNKITFWTHKYDEDYEKYANIGNNLTVRLRAMENNNEYYHRRLSFFRTELENLGELVIKPYSDKLKKSKIRHTKKDTTDGKKSKKIA